MTVGAIAPTPDSKERKGCALTVIVDANPRDPDLLTSVEAVLAAVTGIDAQVIVTCQEPWDGAPAGVDVAVFPSAGQGDRYDAASAGARGDLLAFLSSRVTISPTWAREAVRLFQDPDLVIAGGAVVPEGDRRNERLSALVMTQYLGGTPSAHNARPVPSRRVREVGSSNLVIRTSAFRAIGGFQAPAGANGEAVRLCYKVRTFLGGKVMSEPGLALTAPAPGFPGRLLRDDYLYGRSRGDMARRLPEAAPLFPYAVPSLISLVFCAAVVLVLMAGGGILRDGLLASIVLLLAIPGLPIGRVSGENQHR